MVEKLSFIESLTPSRQAGEVPSLFRIRPVVVDTSFLLPDVLWCTERRYPGLFLACVKFGLVRPFAAHHVWAEVPRKIAEEAADNGVDPRLAEAIWWREYVPRIKFVDVAGLPVPYQSEIMERDPTDAPTMALAGLLAPVVVLAPDRDLRAVAPSDWLGLVRAADAMTAAAGQGWGALVAVRLGGYSLVAGGRGIGRVVRQPVGQVVLGAAALVLLMMVPRWWPRVRDRLPEIGRGIESFVVEKALPVVSTIVDEYQKASEAWSSASYAGTESSLTRDAARALACSPVPLSRTQIVRALLPDAGEAERRRMIRALGHVLATHQAFVQVNAVRWELGTSDVHFGIADDGLAILRSVPRIRPMVGGVAAHTNRLRTSTERGTGP